MFLNKIIQNISLLILILVLTACGGGKSNGKDNSSRTDDVDRPVPFSLNTQPDGVDNTYQGKKTPAKLTQERSLTFLKTLFGFSLSGIDFGSTVSAFGKTTKPYARQVNFTEYGLISGSYQINGELNQQGGVLTAVWKNYSNAKGSMMNGKAIFNIIKVDSEGEISKSTTRYINLDLKDKQQDVLINGYTIEQSDNVTGFKTTIYDVSIKNKNNKKWIALDKLNEIINGDDRRLNGRLYSSDIGYVDIVTQQSFQQCNKCKPVHPVKGKLHFNDAHNNVARFTFTPGSGNANKIDLVLTKSGQNEPEKKTLDWRDFALWKHENVIPRIADLYDPPFYYDTFQNNYIDSLKLKFSSGDKYFDDDGDNVTLSYDWYVNGNLITTNHTDTLSVPSFKAGDDIKIKITADDGYHQVTKTVTGQYIQDTRSIISIKPFPEIIVGKEIILDASDTYDVDIGELSYQWTISNPGAGSWVQVDDAIIAKRNKIQTKVKFLKSGSYELTFRVTQNKAQGDPAVTTKSIILQVIDTERFSPAAYYPHPTSQNLFMSLDDITGDSKTDILLTFKDKKEIALLDKIDNNYKPKVIKLDKQILIRPQIRDINADGRKDILVLHNSGVSVLTQDEQGDFNKKFIEIGRYNKSMISGDFNHDGLIDIAVVTQPPVMSLALLFQKKTDLEGKFSFFPAVKKRMMNTKHYYNFENPHLTVTDFNQDGIDNIMLWANSELDQSDKIVLMLSNFSITDRNTDSEIPVPLGYDLSFKQEDFKLPEAGNGEQINDIVFAHINNDKKLDILEIHTWERNSYFYVYLKEGTLFSAQQRQRHILNKSSGKVNVADINTNGQDDIFYLSSDSAFENYSLIYHLNNNGEIGTIRHRIKLDFDTQPIFADIGDINGDAKNDFVILYSDKLGVIYAK